MTFWEMLVQQDNIAFTENGDRALKSSMSGCADLMFFGGMGKDPSIKTHKIENMFNKALEENPLYAIRLLFYNRDIRGGQGARRFFRIALQYLQKVDEKLCSEIVKYIPEYGRWDDLLCVINTGSAVVTETAMNLIKSTLIDDMNALKNNKSISLLAKWLPSENASSSETKKKAVYIRTWLGMTSKEYRKTLSGLRAYLKVVERNISSKNYEGINYSCVPSNAMMKYTKAFARNDNARYTNYLELLKNNKAKVNASTLYPFDVIKAYNNGFFSENPLVEAQWKSLPDFFNGKKDNSLVVADVSGSMYGDPLNACLGLAIYIAEHNTGVYHDKFITFSHRPTLQTLRGNTLCERAKNLSRAHWDMNTDLNAVFELVYNTAVDNNVSQKELPSMLYIISDMQFDQCCQSAGKSTYTKWKEKFEAAGYTLPTIVFWNVSDRGETVPVKFNENGTMLVSGYSPAVCKFIMSDEKPNTTEDLIKLVVESPRYSCILSNINNK